MPHYEVTDIDRHAAWERRPSCYMDVDKQAWFAGRYDTLEAIQCFARFRHKVLDDAAKTGTFQHRVAPWMDACFGDLIKNDQLERADRFVEESLELAQTMPGFSADRAEALVRYVFGRPVGERSQEVGGVMVTLAALCNAAGLDMATAGETELERIWTKIEAIRAKQAAKPVGSALPIATDVCQA